MGSETEAVKIARIDERVKAIHESLKPLLDHVQKQDVRIAKLERDTFWAHRILGIVAAGGGAPKLLSMLGKMFG